MATPANNLAVPFDGTSDYLNQLKSHLFNLDPNLAAYRTPQPSQDEYDQALEPLAQKSLNVGLNVAGLASANPALAFSGVAAAIADAIHGSQGGDIVGGSPGSVLEGGMHSLPMSTLIKLAQRDTESALSGPTIHDVINSRNQVYHATGNTGGEGILNSGQIMPGTGDQFTGVATSRIPVIPEKTRQLRFAIDPDKMPPSSPTADSGYGKTAPTVMPSYNEVFASLTDKQLDRINQEVKTSDSSIDTSGIKTVKDLQKLSAIDKMSYSNTPTFTNAQRKLSGGVPNPDYEFETRTKGQPIDVNKAITQAIIGTPTDSRFDTDPIELYSNLLQSKNPLPASIINRNQLPLYRILAQKWLSQQVTGK